MPLASIYPLVSTRALARPFTYEVGDAVARGDILSIRLGARAVRGVVVDVGVDPPPGVEVVSAGPAVGSAAPELVELALWLADYHGSPPAPTPAPGAPPPPARTGP